MISDGNDDDGSLVVAVLVSVVGMLMSAVLATIVIGQLVTARDTTERQHAIDAALAGLDIATGHLRAAGDAQGDGVRSALPCGPFAGSVGAGSGTYAVSIEYLSTSGAPLLCLAGKGTATTPATAKLVATGIDRSSGPKRTLEATYLFRTTNQNIPGGLVHVYQVAGNPDLCLDAGSASPAPGTPLIVQPCIPGSRQQTFAYNLNLTLSLVSSASAAQSLGMCVDGGAVPHSVDGAPVTFQPCGTTTQPRQQWAFNDNANFEGTSDGQDLDGYCFNVQNPGSAGSPVVLRNASGKCYGSTNGNNPKYNNEQNFSPDRRVGAGAAGAATQQLVNFYEFGRCLDVTNQDWYNPQWMIVWPCKQSPDGSKVLWNQKWQVPEILAGSSEAAGLISTTPSYASDYTTCLVSPLAITPGTWVKLEKCPTSGPLPDRMNWTVHGNTGVYATSYTIVDKGGNCLAPTDPDAANPDLDPDGDKVSKTVVVRCSGSTLEKWNAPANVLEPSPLRNIGER